MSLKHSLLSVLLVAVAFAAGGWWQGQSDPAPVAPGVTPAEAISGDAASELARLQMQLQAQQSRLDRLEAQIASYGEAGGAGIFALEIDGATAGGGVDEARVPTPEVAAEATRRWRGSVSVEQLEEAGFSAATAAEIVQVADGLSYERLRLRYEAARDGGSNAEQYREAMAELRPLREELEERFGDDAYDRYLYATGRSNRVVVTDVLQESPAHQIGLQRGDVLVGMDGQRVYSARDIMSIASNSDASGNVPITIRRDGVLLEYYVPPGPLGIRSSGRTEAPATGGG